ncbi:unnamed protein product [Eretmochelys imbricata]
MAQPGPRVAILREEGSNGGPRDGGSLHHGGVPGLGRDHAGPVHRGGDSGVVPGPGLCGGLQLRGRPRVCQRLGSFGDLQPPARAQFEAFHRRRDTFSLGVCNGCQLMALLGWVGGESPTSDPPGGGRPSGVLLAPNISGRFESRFVALAIEQSQR